MHCGSCRARRLRYPRLRRKQHASIAQLTYEIRQSWSELLRDADVVVHLSSRTDLRAAEADPAGDEDINVRPLRALVETARGMGKAPTIVFASAATIVGPNPQMRGRRCRSR